MSELIVIFSTLYSLFSMISPQRLTLPFHIEDYNITSNSLRHLDPIQPIQTQYQTASRTVVNLCLGFPPQCFDLVIQTNSFYFWVNDGNSTNQSTAPHKMDIYNSDKLERYPEVAQELHYNSEKVQGYQAYDKLWVGKIQVDKFQFILATQTSSLNIDGMIGLGYEPTLIEEDYSFLHQLYRDKYISQKVFVQVFTGTNIGLLHIGELPQEINDNQQKTRYCQALDIYHGDEVYRNKNWECELDGVFYGEDKSAIQRFAGEKISFFSYRKRTFIPQSMYDTFKNSYFDKTLKEGKCIEYSSRRYQSFQCTMLDETFKDINLVFSNSVLRLKAKDMFQQIDTYYYFILYKKKNLDSWVLGRSVLKEFHIIYDSHNERIGFYNRDGQVFSLNQSKPPEDLKTDKEEDSHQKPITTDVIEGLEKKERRKLSNAFIAQAVFVLFIIVAIIVLGIVGFFSYRRYRRKNVFPSNDYFYQKTTNMIKEEGFQ